MILKIVEICRTVIINKMKGIIIVMITKRRKD